MKKTLKKKTPIQQKLPFPNRWGGARKGAGRPKFSKKVNHIKRENLPSHCPVHVTWRMVEGLPNLRSSHCFPVIKKVLYKFAVENPNARVVHFSVQKNHIHLIVEARSKLALSRGLQGLGIRLARAIQGAANYKGRVFADRYHSRILRNPREVRNALLYVLNNARRHYKQQHRVVDDNWFDSRSSAKYFNGWRGRKFKIPDEEEHPVERPHTWLLQKGWQRHGLLELWAIPGKG